ncbi:MAG: right-handed parallel beta-helix repeat-containing protein, partial [Candidatus Thorarchaeota archaeon]|nr:right-handed parallel beta-helix repeat-containing protein [Candidatus Thorarchaeota archaeon]
DSDAVVLENNQVSNSDWDDIRLDSSTHCTLENNVLDLRGLYIVGDLLEHWIHTIPANNLVDSRPIVYALNISLGSVDLSTAGQMILVNCSDVQTVNGGTIDNKTAGMIIAFATNCEVIELVTQDCTTGILVFNSINCSVINSDFYGSNLNNQMGIFSDTSPGTIITGCHIQWMDYGIYMEYSPDSLINLNTVSNSTFRGIEINDSPDSRISSNGFTFITSGCIDVTSSDFCLIDNNFLYGETTYSGIGVYNSEYCIVEDNLIVVEMQGIYLSSASGIRIENNTISGDYAGIIFTNTEDSEVYLNDIGYTGILFQTDYLTYWNHTFATNDVGGLPLGYFESLDNAVLNAADYGQLVLIDCENVTVNGYSRDAISCLIYIVSSINVSASDYFITNTVKGIVILYSDDCSITNYTVEYISSKGMYLYE